MNHRASNNLRPLQVYRDYQHFFILCQDKKFTERRNEMTSIFTTKFMTNRLTNTFK